MSSFFRDSRIWAIINLLTIPIGVVKGYRDALSITLRSEDHPEILCLSIIVLVPVVVLFTAARGKGALRIPSLRSCPLRWRRDPLAFLMGISLLALGNVLGSTLGLWKSGTRGLWMVAAYGSLLLGVLIGQALVYQIFRREIMMNGESPPAADAPFGSP